MTTPRQQFIDMAAHTLEKTSDTVYFSDREIRDIITKISDMEVTPDNNELITYAKSCSTTGIGFKRLINDIEEKAKNIRNKKNRKKDQDQRFEDSLNYIVIFPSDNPSYKYRAALLSDNYHEGMRGFSFYSVAYGDTAEEAMQNIKNQKREAYYNK